MPHLSGRSRSGHRRGAPLSSSSPALARDGHLYVTANQLHRQDRYQGGEHLRRRPFALFRFPVDADPVLLR